VKQKDRILGAVVEGTVYVKPVGYAVQKNSLGLPDFLEAMLRQGASKVVFDLAECEGMDSTFLGVIASVAVPQAGGVTSAVLLNADEEARRELRMVGLLSVMAVKEETCQAPEELQLRPVDSLHLPDTERERLQRLKDLHGELIKLNEKNRRQWGAFVEMLEQELQED
jgi:anti-anti-sigma regulatory factor